MRLPRILVLIIFAISHRIKDLRRQWGKPQLPVSIAVSGFDGFDGEEASRQPKGCWDKNETKTNCNCKNDRGCRRLDLGSRMCGQNRFSAPPPGKDWARTFC